MINYVNKKEIEDRFSKRLIDKITFGNPCGSICLCDQTKRMHGNAGWCAVGEIDPDDIFVPWFDIFVGNKFSEIDIVIQEAIGGMELRYPQLFREDCD